MTELPRLAIVRSVSVLTARMPKKTAEQVLGQVRCAIDGDLHSRGEIGVLRRIDDELLGRGRRALAQTSTE